MSTEMRRLEAKCSARNGWPKWLQWLEISGIRGWHGQRISFDFPIVAIVGENGSGKSTILQSAACVYQNPDGRTWYPTEFFPETAWDHIDNVRIGFSYRQGEKPSESSIRKPTTRWLGQPARPLRSVSYIGLDRLQPVSTRVGYARIAKTKHQEKSAKDFDKDQLQRLSFIMGEEYDFAKMAISSIDDNREIPVLSKSSMPYSGYHHGMGELTTAELISENITKYSLVLIDEIESSLHPRAQRRLIRDLARIARDTECQIILSTHSSTILEELPMNARIYILRNSSGRSIVNGVTPQFAMTKMDDEDHPDCEVYVEDERAKTWLAEILSKHAPDLFVRCRIIPYGTANLGVALGQMAKAKRFPRPTVIFLDGEQETADGCILLPGGDAPERVVFDNLGKGGWGDIHVRISRDYSDVSDACQKAMTLSDHHEWVKAAANQLRCGGDVLWQAMCSEWAKVKPVNEVQYLLEGVRDAILYT
ncbi:MAG: AAA family ATPase [Methylocella sp.]